jgi:hypothetical protein
MLTPTIKLCRREAEVLLCLKIKPSTYRFDFFPLFVLNKRDEAILFSRSSILSELTVLDTKRKYFSLRGIFLKGFVFSFTGKWWAMP